MTSGFVGSSNGRAETLGSVSLRVRRGVAEMVTTRPASLISLLKAARDTRQNIALVAENSRDLQVASGREKLRPIRALVSPIVMLLYNGPADRLTSRVRVYERSGEHRSGRKRVATLKF